MAALKTALLVGGGLFLLSGVVDMDGGIPFVGDGGCEVEPVTAENMYDPSMPWLPDPESCPEFYEGDPQVHTGPFPPGFDPSTDPAIVPDETGSYSDWGGPWYLEGPSCWALSDC